MRKEYKALVKIVLVLAFVAFWLTALLSLFFQRHGYVQALPNGYRFFGGEAGVVLDNKNCGASYQQIGPDVDGYRVYKHIIVGHVAHNPEIQNNMYRPREGEHAGYFIIDLETNKISSGLNNPDWRHGLQKYHVDHEPELFKPSRRDARLGRTKPQ